MTTAGLMLGALALEALLGWPDALDRRIGHPVRWLGWLIGIADRCGNRPDRSEHKRWIAGAVSTLLIVGIAALVGILIDTLLPDNPLGWGIEIVIVASLVAGRSLYDHVAAVADALGDPDIDKARIAVGRIVGRETGRLDRSAIAAAAIESLAENTSDGVTAPIISYLLFGLPGLLAYKAINTLDSMIGHRTQTYAAFGNVAARLDDLANLLPARLTGLLFCLIPPDQKAFAILWRDAPGHRSPNAGWPEAAMAGMLGVRLGGPRCYGGQIAPEPWLNEAGQPADRQTLVAALALYRRLLLLIALLLLGWSLA